MIVGALLLFVGFGGFGAWAFRTTLAAAVISPASFVATGQNKIVQHLEGGIIKDLLVVERDVVAAGDTLLSLDETAAEANERELFIRQARLEAMEARLSAHYRRGGSVQFPRQVPEIQSNSEIATILDSQNLAFDVARRARENDVSPLEHRCTVDPGAGL